jgi:hypothetical protein
MAALKGLLIVLKEAASSLCMLLHHFLRAQDARSALLAKWQLATSTTGTSTSSTSTINTQEVAKNPVMLAEFVLWLPLFFSSAFVPLFGRY